MVFSNDTSFALDTSEVQNKCLVSAKDIETGTAIFSEDVILFGPVPDAKSPICLGCGVNVDSSSICFDCGWPICGLNCDKLRLHKANECEVFRKCPNMSFQRFASKKLKFHHYDCILPLRILFLKERNPDKWRSLEMLNYDIEMRRGSASWKNEEVFVVKFIRQKCRLKQFDEELIHQVCSIIEANCFLFSNSKNNVRCIYATANYFSHNCMPNCAFVILPNEDFRIYVRATVDIRKGEKLTCCKIKPILPTLLRRQELLHSAHLSCNCKRCQDPIELNSHFSSLKCPKCRKGEVVSLNPLDFESDWKCVRCRYEKSYENLKSLYNEVEKELNNITKVTSTETSMKMCEKLMKKYGTKLHANHAFLVFAKYSYLLSSLNGETFHKSDYANVETKIKWLEEILNVFDIISPGYTFSRGMTLHMLHKAFVIKAKKYNTSRKDEQQQFTKYMTKALSYLDIAEKILVIEKSSLKSNLHNMSSS